MALLSNTGIRAGASAAGGGGYQIEKSLRFNEPDSAKLSRTFTAAGDQTKFTLSFWFKNCDAGTTNSKMLFCLDNGGSSQLELYDGRLATQFYDTTGSGWWVSANTSTTHLFRDPSAWYHIVLSIDTTAGTTNADRHKIYINGEQLTLTFSTAWGGLMTGKVKGWNTAAEHFIGMRGSSYGGNWLAAEYYFIDGQALDASSFGETDSTTGQWVAKKYSGTYGPLVDQSQTWSDSVTNPSGAYGVAANAFDGNLDTHASPAYANPMTYTNASPSDTVIQTFEVKCDIYTMSGITVELNDTDITSQLTTTDQWHTITGFTDEQFEKFYWRPSVENYEVKVKAIRINGKILVDDDVTVVDNSFYLKFNGTDIGEDSSGNDNDWTAVNLTAASTTFNVPCVSFDGTDDYLELADSTDFDFGTSDFTMECFVKAKRQSSANWQSLVMKADAGTTYAGSSWWWALYTDAAGVSYVSMYLYDGTNYKVISSGSGAHIAENKWAHIAFVRDGDTARLYVDGVEKDTESVSGWTQNSCSNTVRIGSDGGANYDLNGAISNVRIVNGTCLYPSGTTFTVPSRPLANVTNTKLLCCQSSTQASAATVAHTVSGSINAGTGWSDLVKGTIDSTYSSSDRSVPFNGTAWGSSLANTIRPGAGAWLEMDFGTRFNSATSVKITGQASLDGDTYNGSNENLEINGTAIGSSAWEDNGGGGAGSTGSATFSLSSGLQTLKWGYSSGSQSTGYLYLAAIEVDGVELKNPLLPRGSLGEFEAGTTLSDDTSDADVLTDTPTDFDDGGNGTGNYCTLNPLAVVTGSPTFRQGNLQIVGTAWTSALATMPLPATGKWYFETVIDSDASPRQVNNYACAGFGGSDSQWGQNSAHIIDFGAVMEYYPATTATTLHANGTFALDDVAGWAIDMDNWKYSIYKNGTVLVDNRDIPQDEGTQLWPFCANYDLSYGYLKMNFGQLGFQQTPPTDYKALNTYNLPDPVIKDPSKYFEAKTYTGTGSALNITGFKFSPDLVWLKSRSAGASGNILDTVRGRGKQLIPSGTDTEGSEGSTAGLTTFNSDGFSLGTDNAGAGQVNANGSTYISWNWDSGTANKVNTEIDQSQDWSSTSNLGGSSTEAAKAFLGYNFLSGTGTVAYDNTGNNVLTTAPLSGVTKLEIMTNRTHSGATDGTKITIDGTAYYDAALAANGWSEVNLGGATISNTSGDSIYIKDEGGSASALWAVRVNGKVLVDSGNSLASVPSIYAGGLNSTVYNKSSTWSGSNNASTGPVKTESGSYYAGGYDGKWLFDGRPAYMVMSTAAGHWIEWTPADSAAADGGAEENFTFTDTVEVQLYDATNSVNFTITYSDDTTSTTEVSSTGWTTIATGGGVLKKLKAESTNTSSGWNYWTGVKIDGKQLVDDDQSVEPNVPTIASTYRANPSAGFSIVNYTGNGTSGATFAHGLNAKPDFAIFKNRDDTRNWNVYHKSIGNTHHFELNDTAGKLDDVGAWNDTDPDSNVMTLGNQTAINANSQGIIAYIWSGVEGYSKFGEYEGNGSTEGTFVYCGFRPKYLLVKRHDASGDFRVLDSARDTYNPRDSQLYPNNADAEIDSSAHYVDFLSNGFRLTTDHSAMNGSGDDFVFAAFADKPFKYSNAV